MATNVELERQLIAAKKEISELRGEVDKLKGVSAAAVSAELAALLGALDKTFRVLSCHEWFVFKREAMNEIQEMDAATSAKG